MQRVLGGQRHEFGYQLGVLAALEVHGHPLAQRVQAQLGQPRGLVPVQAVRGHVGQRGPAPQGQRLVHPALVQQCPCL